MRLKLDENLPRSALPRLAALGFDVDTVLDENLGGRNDDTVWAAAQSEQRFLVTQDLDFSDARRFVPGTHAGVLIVRLPDTEQWRVRITWWPGSRARMRGPGRGARWSLRRIRFA